MSTSDGVHIAPEDVHSLALRLFAAASQLRCIHEEAQAQANATDAGMGDLQNDEAARSQRRNVAMQEGGGNERMDILASKLEAIAHRMMRVSAESPDEQVASLFQELRDLEQAGVGLR